MLLWRMTMAVAAVQRWDAATRSLPPSVQWMNIGPIRQNTARVRAQYPDHEAWDLPTLAFASLPTPSLAASDPGFNLDYFTYQYFDFGTRRLLDAFAVGQDIIRYAPVDTAASAIPVGELGYCVFDVLPRGNPFDQSRVPGRFRDVRQVDGTVRTEWVIALRDNLPPKRFDLYLRDDFEPPAPVFRATGTPWIYVVDDFADRVMRSGISDMAFVSIEPTAMGQPALRTLG